MLDLRDGKTHRTKQQVDVGSLLTLDGVQSLHNGDEASNHWECLNVWVDHGSMATWWETSDHAVDSFACCDHEVLCDSLHGVAPFPGWQPYVSHETQWDTPFNSQAEQSWHSIAVGVDVNCARPFAFPCGSTCDRMADGAAHTMDMQFTAKEECGELAFRPADDEQAGEEQTIHADNTCSPKKLEDSLSGWKEAAEMAKRDSEGQGVDWAPSLWTPERPGQPGPAVGGTQSHSLSPTGVTQCALLGGGKRGISMDAIYEDDQSNTEQLAPGLLQNRLLVLQQRALEAIQALPVQCREDYAYGKVETRIWGLEALKHVLRMRLALQSNLPLTRPIDHEPEMPPANELLAANLTLNIGNKGNRCYANTVLRMWCCAPP